MKKYTKVLVPFYRGAVVFSAIEFMDKLLEVVLVPFYRGAVVFGKAQDEFVQGWAFSSPFIEERLYLRKPLKRYYQKGNGSRPPLSRSGCI